MKQALKTAMMDSISEVFETMFFISLEFSDLDSIDKYSELSTGNVIVSMLEYTGKFSGHFVLCVPEILLKLITENFIGIDINDITEQNMTDTLKEAINMTGGNTFTNYDSNIEFNLNIPKIIKQEDIHKLNTKAKFDEIAISVETIDGAMCVQCVFSQ